MSRPRNHLLEEPLRHRRGCSTFLAGSEPGHPNPIRAEVGSWQLQPRTTAGSVAAHPRRGSLPSRQLVLLASRASTSRITTGGPFGGIRQPPALRFSWPHRCQLVRRHGSDLNLAFGRGMNKSTFAFFASAFIAIVAFCFSSQALHARESVPSTSLTKVILFEVQLQDSSRFVFSAPEGGFAILRDDQSGLLLGIQPILVDDTTGTIEFHLFNFFDPPSSKQGGQGEVRNRAYLRLGSQIASIDSMLGFEASLPETSVLSIKPLKLSLIPSSTDGQQPSLLLRTRPGSSIDLTEMCCVSCGGIGGCATTVSGSCGSCPVRWLDTLSRGLS